MVAKMDRTDETNPEYTYNLHLVKDLLNTNSHKVVERVINKVMEVPMSEFKIEVITNNAERLANYLYTHFKRPATELLVEEILALVGVAGKENRLSLIIYCLEQVSLQLSPKHKSQFIRMINSNIIRLIEICQKGTSPNNQKTLITFVNMVIFFLNSTPIDEIDDLDIIIGQMSPLIFFKDETISTLGHKIYLLVISDHKSVKTSEYIRQMKTSFENNISNDSQNVWENEEVLKDYISSLVKGTAYGREEVMEESLEMLEFIIAHTPRPLVEKYILKIVGPLIRISNYPLLMRQKVRIMELLGNVYKQGFRLEVYTNQVLSVCLRLLQEFKHKEEAIETVANIYFLMLQHTVLKKEIVVAILGKLKAFSSTLTEAIYCLVKKIIKDGLELPKNLLEKIHEEVTALFIQQNEKIAIKSVYYASKTSAKLGVLLGKPIERIESQLKGLAVPYETILNYLHYANEKKARIARMETIEIFIKESNREKVYYLLKALSQVTRHS
jgi:hypothetical protein